MKYEEKKLSTAPTTYNMYRHFPTHFPTTSNRESRNFFSDVVHNVQELYQHIKHLLYTYITSHYAVLSLYLLHVILLSIATTTPFLPSQKCITLVSNLFRDVLLTQTLIQEMNQAHIEP